MCLSTAYWSNDTETPILKEIAHIQLKEDRIILYSLMGDQKIIKGRIRDIDFLNARLIVDRDDSTSITSK